MFGNIRRKSKDSSADANCKNLCVVMAAIAPSPTAAATCWGEPFLMSPAATMEEISVSSLSFTTICPFSSRGIVPSRYSVFGNIPTWTNTR